MRALVVTLDRLPVHFLGCYGNRWIETPHFDSLAAHGVVFDQHLAENVDPAAARHAWSTGCYTFRRTPAEQQSLPDLDALLTGRGVIVRHVWEEGARREHGATRGEPGNANLPETEPAGSDGLDADPADTSAARLVDEALAALEDLPRAPDQSWLLWVHARGVPVPWLAPREFARRYLDLLEDEEDDDEPGFDAEEDDEEEYGDDYAEDEADDYDELDDLDAEYEEEDEQDFDEEDLADDDPRGEDEARSFDDQDDEDDAAESSGEPFRFLEFSDDEFDAFLAGRASLPREPAARKALSEVDRRVMRALYGGYVSYLDQVLGGLLRAVASQVPQEDLLLIVTAGRGEELDGISALPGDAARLAEEVVHAPLLILMPRPSEDVGSRRQALVQTVDLAPTLADWFGIDPADTGFEGASLLPLVRDERAQLRETAFAGDGARARGLRTEQAYLVRVRSQSAHQHDDEAPFHLFLKPEDVWDVHNVADQSPDFVDALAARLDEFAGGQETPGTEPG